MTTKVKWYRIIMMHYLFTVWKLINYWSLVGGVIDSLLGGVIDLLEKLMCVSDAVDGVIGNRRLYGEISL